MLKANLASLFKSQKPKKLSSQWEKVKNLMPNIDLNKPIEVRDTGQGDRGLYSLKPKPPDPPILLDGMNTRRMEEPKEEGSSKGNDPSGK